MTNWLEVESARRGGIIWGKCVQDGLEVTLRAVTHVSGHQCGSVNSVQNDNQRLQLGACPNVPNT